MEDLRWDSVSGLINKEIVGETDGIFKLVFKDGLKQYGFVMTIGDIRNLSKTVRALKWEYFKLCLRHPLRVKKGSLNS